MTEHQQDAEWSVAEWHGEELSQADASALYHHYELNYTPPTTDSGRRLARR
jgi:hypothetical protein